MTECRCNELRSLLLEWYTELDLIADEMSWSEILAQNKRQDDLERLGIHPHA